MTVALAGRRIDAPDARQPRFPLANCEMVRLRIRHFFERWQAENLVCSAACGADLIALDVAGMLGLRRRVILPCSPDRFRAISVVDRPGDWGPLYDEIIAKVEASGDLLTREPLACQHESFASLNPAILDEAVKLSGRGDGIVKAVIVWDGRPRGEDDLTCAFAAEARSRGMAAIILETL